MEQLHHLGSTALEMGRHGDYHSEDCKTMAPMARSPGSHARQQSTKENSLWMALPTMTEMRPKEEMERCD